MVDVCTRCVVPLHKSATLALSVKHMHDGWIAGRDCDTGHRAQFIKAWLLYLAHGLRLHVGYSSPMMHVSLL